MLRLMTVLAFLSTLVAPAQATDLAALDLLKQPGHHLILRHALAPGGGDPDDFQVDDCSTQRNLNETGREQARALGGLLRERGIAVDDVFSSQWCRCLDTATEMAVAPVTELPPLNSFFQNRAAEPAQTAALRDFLASYPKDKTAVLVTHQVNITAITGGWVNSGAGHILRVEADGSLTVVASVEP
ncbi:MAG: histidine phosphatase family protein [Alphaproteobacteria bacterium]|nr:histidine phosphatase family protein [Alphaproteobacteria bacterium]